MYYIKTKNKRLVWIKLYLLQTINNYKKTINSNKNEDQDDIYIIRWKHTILEITNIIFRLII